MRRETPTIKITLNKTHSQAIFTVTFPKSEGRKPSKIGVDREDIECGLVDYPFQKRTTEGIAFQWDVGINDDDTVIFESVEITINDYATKKVTKSTCYEFHDVRAEFTVGELFGE